MSGLNRNLAALAVLVFSITLHAAPLGTTFTYQGKLVQNGVDVTELCDFNFGLWDAAGGGSQVATAINTPNVQVTGGTFTVELDYGAGVFDGQARWLEIAVACPTGGGLTTLAPRQELTPSPHALFAAEAEAMEWTGLQNIPPDIADGDDVDDDDADASNELQDLSLAGNSLSLTGDATPVDLSGYLDNTDDQTLAEVLIEGNDAGGTTITNLPAPVADSDASTKAYVDSQGGAQNLTDVLMQGNDAGGITITNLPAPLADSDASTKAYVDSQGGAQDLTDVLMQGNDAGGITITNLPAPVAGSDAATRTYVDGHVDADFDPTNELQDLDLSGNSLSLTGDASPVNLSGYLDNTDDQMLDLTADQLSIENGNSVDLSGYLDNTDDQTLAEVLGEGNDAGGVSITNIGTTTTNALTISGLDCTGNTNGGALTADASGVVSCSDDNGGSGMGNTLDEAYDQGGAGAGRTIMADSGAVTIEGIDGLELDAANLLQTPANPVVIGSVSMLGVPQSVYISGRYAYVDDIGNDELKVIDVSDPGLPVVVGFVGVGTDPTDVFVSGRYAYILEHGTNELKVIDVSNPNSPSEIGGVGVGNSASDVYVSGRHAYVIDTDSDRMKVIDVSDPASPSEIGSVLIGTVPNHIFVSGRYAYVTDFGTFDLKVIDISDPTSPSVVGTAGGIPGGPRGLYVSGRWAYVTHDGSALEVFDISNPSAPVMVGDLQLGLLPGSVHVSGRYAYISGVADEDLKVIDISDPTAPTLAGAVTLGGTPVDVYVAGRYAYVIDQGGGMDVIDVSGGEFSSMMAHSLDAGNLQVRNDIIAQGQLQVTGGVNVGNGGIFSDGDVGVAGSISATTDGIAITGTSDGMTGRGIQGIANGLGGVAVEGIANESGGRGVEGVASVGSGFGVRGVNTATTGEAIGVYGSSSSPTGYGVYGEASNSVGASAGLFGVSSGDGGVGAVGVATRLTGPTIGVSGGSFSQEGIGVRGVHYAATGHGPGVEGETRSLEGADTSSGVAFAATQTAGVVGKGTFNATDQIIHGVVGQTYSTTGGGVYATNLSSDPSNSPDLVLGISDYGGGGDNGIISSEPSDGNSDIFLHSMDTVVVRLNQDGDNNGGESANSRFEVSYTPLGGSANRVFYIDSSGDVFADGGYHCGNSIDDLAGTLSESEIAPCLLDDSPADFAEMLPSVGESQPGDVLVAAPDGSLIQSWSAYSGNVVGVYSTRPSYLGNARKLDADDHVPLAVSGIVPVRASAENGAIQAGDLLTSAGIPGHAMRCEGVERCFGRVIGKALEPLPADTGMIRILVSLN